MVGGEEEVAVIQDAVGGYGVCLDEFRIGFCGSGIED